MPPLQPRVRGPKDDLKTDAKDDPETGAKDDPETGAKDGQGKIDRTEERVIPENKLEAIPMNARNATKNQEVKGAITRKATENQPRRRNTEMAKKIAITRKDLATEIEINEEREGTKRILEKIVGQITGKRRKSPKRKESVVFSPSFSGIRHPLGMPKQRVHAHSGSL